MYLQFNDNRAREVFAILQGLWEKKEGVFQDIVLPQNRVLLSDDPVRKANWLLFAAITQRGGIVSEDPFKYLVALEQRYPSLMDPWAILDQWGGPDHIQKALIEIIIERTWKKDKTPAKGQGKGMYKVDEFATSWWQNALTLVCRWDGNVLNAFEGARDFEDFFARVDYRRNKFGLHGMRRKILSLFTIWLQEFGLVPVFPTPVPVDFHAMRLLFSTGVVVAHDIPPFVVKPGKHPHDMAGRPLLRVTEQLMDEIAVWSQGFIQSNGFSHLAINPALWVLSRELCVSELQNQSRSRKSSMRVNWSELLERYPQLWPTAYNDPSLHCPLAAWCTKTVAWGPYYDWGLLTLDRRVPYPHPYLPGLTPGLRRPRRRKNSRA